MCEVRVSRATLIALLDAGGRGGVGGALGDHDVVAAHATVDGGAAVRQDGHASHAGALVRRAVQPYSQNLRRRGLGCAGSLVRPALPLLAGTHTYQHSHHRPSGRESPSTVQALQQAAAGGSTQAQHAATNSSPAAAALGQAGEALGFRLGDAFVELKSPAVSSRRSTQLTHSHSSKALFTKKGLGT